MRSYTDICYGDESASAQMLDIHLPDCDTFPVFIYFHGGCLTSGDKANHRIMPQLLTQNGICFVSANYRMYPNAAYPDFLEDAALAVSFIMKNIKNYGNATDIFVGGSSAGGYISMMLCFKDALLLKHGIKPTDISGFIHDAGQPTAHFSVLQERGLDPRRVIVDDSCPLYFIGTAPAYPRMLFIVADNDMQNRYEQTMLTLQTLRHFGHNEDTFSLKVMQGKHCCYLNKPIFAETVTDFIKGMKK